MEHIVKIGEDKIKVNMMCNHPDIDNAQCPIGHSNCEECRYSLATMSIPAFMKLYKEVSKES